MKIEVFGPGCAKCEKTAENAREAVSELGIEAEVVKVVSIDEILDRGVMMTPAVFIDDKKFSEGKLVRTDKIKDWIEAVLKEGERE